MRAFFGQAAHCLHSDGRGKVRLDRGINTVPVLNLVTTFYDPILLPKIGIVQSSAAEHLAGALKIFVAGITASCQF
jgi:hypothetical protein